MPFVLARLLARLRLLRGWATPVIVVVFVFATSWPLMALAEPGGSELVQPANYWWYFVVTSATVGYGDFSPVSGLGHVVGVYVITGGIVTLTTVFAKLAMVLDSAKGRRMQGMTSVDVAGHVVLLGYVAGRTDRMIDQLQSDGVGRVVLGAWDEVPTHPMPEADVDFVRGELTSEDVLRRAGVHRARSVLVDARDDHEALAITVAVGHVNSDAHLVIAVRDMGKTSLFKYLSDDVRCVQWHVPRMITEELITPGITEMYAVLMTHGGANTYSLALPETLGPVLVESCQTALGRLHGATVLAARVDGELTVNPDWRTELPAGAILYYVSPDSLTPEQVERAVRGL